MTFELGNTNYFILRQLMSTLTEWSIFYVKYTVDRGLPLLVAKPVPDHWHELRGKEWSVFMLNLQRFFFFNFDIFSIFPWFLIAGVNVTSLAALRLFSTIGMYCVVRNAVFMLNLLRIFQFRFWYHFFSHELSLPWSMLPRWQPWGSSRLLECITWYENSFSILL